MPTFMHLKKKKNLYDPSNRSDTNCWEIKCFDNEKMAQECNKNFVTVIGI